MQLTHIMPWEEWVHFEKGFNERTGLNCCLIDQDGVRITAYHKWSNALCPAIRGDAAGRAAICEQIRSILAEVSPLEGGMRISTCRAGMLVICVPIMQEGLLLGFAGGCGMVPEHSAIDTLAVSKATGLSIAKIQGMARDIAALDPKEIDAMGKYLLGRIKDILER